MKIVRTLLSREQVVEALGCFVANHHNLPPQTANAEVFMTYDVISVNDIQIKQARVEITLPDASY